MITMCRADAIGEYAESERTCVVCVAMTGKNSPLKGYSEHKSLHKTAWFRADVAQEGACGSGKCFQPIK
jgi:hypothetical protein